MFQTAILYDRNAICKCNMHFKPSNVRPREYIPNCVSPEHFEKTIELRKWQSFICASSCLLPYCTSTLKPPNAMYVFICSHLLVYCPACRTYLIATRIWVVVICPIIKCLTVLEFSFILFDLCLFITIFNSILNYVPIVTFWIFTYHKIWILLIIFCFIWNYWIIFFNMFGSVLGCCELTGVSLLWPWLIKWK